MAERSRSQESELFYVLGYQVIRFYVFGWGGTRMTRIWRKPADFSTALIWGCGTEIRRGARRNTKILFWKAEITNNSLNSMKN